LEILDLYIIVAPASFPFFLDAPDILFKVFFLSNPCPNLLFISGKRFLSNCSAVFSTVDPGWKYPEKLPRERYVSLELGLVYV
jgi:hypothetical protein